MHSSRILASLPLLACIVLSRHAGAATTSVRTYSAPGGGSLELSVPLRWHEQIAWPEGEPGAAILRFSPDSGLAEWAVSITVLRPPDTDTTFGSPARLRSLVEESARASLGIEPGTDLRIESLESGGGNGWFFSVVDHGV